MKFSIIIPVHNCEKYLDKCIESALAQKGDFEKELIIIENGSDDNSGLICDKYAKEHDNIAVFHEGKLGAYKARRVGMKRATGDYVVFLDADDALKDNALENLEQATENLPEVILYNAQNMGEEEGMKFSFPFSENHLYLESDKKAFYDLMCLGDSLNALWNKCLKRSLVERIISIENPDVPGMFNHGEDLTQTAQILDEAKSILFINKALYEYRKDNSGGLTTNYSPQYINQQEFAWKQLLHYAGKWQKTEGEYENVIVKRMALTCTIAITYLLKSSLSWNDLKEELDTIIRKPFYRQYANGELPVWAPEEACYVHKLQMSDNPYKKLLADAGKIRIKRRIKTILGRK